MVATQSLVDIWSLTATYFQVINPHVSSIVMEAINEVGMADFPYLNYLLIAERIAPEPLSVSRWQHNKAAEYTNPEHIAGQLATLTEHGFFQANGDGSYERTAKASAAVDTILSAQRSVLETLEPLSEAEIERLLGLCDRIIDAALAVAEPASKIGIQDALRPIGSEALPPMEQFLRRIARLNAFRDDCHIASWKRHDITGQDWETFTYVVQGNAGTAEELAQNLNFRGYSADDYAASLTRVAECGWIVAEGDKYVGTDAGKTLREASEEETNRLFFAPWSANTPAELDELRDLWQALCDGLKIEAEA